MAVKTLPWSVQDHIATPERQAGYLEAALELAIKERDPGFFAKALGDVARARGIADIAASGGVTRSALYKALSQDGDPRLSTLLEVISTLDVKLAIKPVTRKRRVTQPAP